MTTEPHVALFNDPKRLLLDMAREHSLPELLRMVVCRLAESPRVALVRIWLVQLPTDGCAACPAPTACRDQPGCLHLVAKRRVGRRSIRGSSGHARTGRSDTCPWACGRSGGSRRPATRLEVPDLCARARTGWWTRYGCAPRASPGSAASLLSTAGRCSASWACSARGPIGPECMSWLPAPSPTTPPRPSQATSAGVRAHRGTEEEAGTGERVPPRGGRAGRLVRRTGGAGAGAGRGRAADRPRRADRIRGPVARRERDR